MPRIKFTCLTVFLPDTKCFLSFSRMIESLLEEHRYAMMLKHIDYLTKPLLISLVEHLTTGP